MSGRIAKEIAVIRQLDEQGRANYKEAMAREIARYSEKYAPVNWRMSEALGVNLVDDLMQYPGQLKIIENKPKTRGLAWNGNIWVSNEVPYADKVKNHELAHIAFEHSTSNLPTVIQEIQAEGTAYGVGHRLGIPLDVLAMSTAPTIYSRAKQYSPEQIDNMIDANKRPITEMIGTFMKGTAPSGYRIAQY